MVGRQAVRAIQTYVSGSFSGVTPGYNYPINEFLGIHLAWLFRLDAIPVVQPLISKHWGMKWIDITCKKYLWGLDDYQLTQVN